MSEAENFHKWRTSKSRGAVLDGLLLRAVDEVQAYASLRFDGYAWLDANRVEQPGYLSDRWQERFDRDGGLPRDPAEAMALAFTLQRADGRGVYLSYGPMHKLWRAVLLRTMPLAVPPLWLPRTIDPTFGERWTRLFVPHLADALRCVGEVHDRIDYAIEEPNGYDPKLVWPDPLLRPRRRNGRKRGQESP